MTRASKEQLAAALNINPFGVLMVDWGIKYSPPTMRMWPGRLLRPTCITQCQVCGGELWIDNASPAWMCQICRSSGNAVNLLQHLTGCTFQRAVVHLTRRAVLNCQSLSKSAKQRALAKTRKLEDVAQRYGLAIAETTTTPELPWPPKILGGKTFVTTCPNCKDALFIYVNVDRQLWRCPQCSRGYSTRVLGQDGDAIEFVRHVSGCTFNTAVWYLAGGGPQPRRK